jgi:hypothetical protein
VPRHVYLINDVRDREADRLHPVNRAADCVGRAPVGAATTAAVVLAAVARICVCPRRPPGIVGAMCCSRCIPLAEASVIRDVLTIAVGFVLR